MVLHPLEFTECFLDPPWFRQSIKEHEDELENTNTQIKQLIKDAKAMLQACRKQGEMTHVFGERLKKFQFDIIGENLTDAERGIAGSLNEFGTMLEEIEAEWTRTIERWELQLIEPLERFRKEHIHSYREAKKLFDKSSDRYYKQMESTLGLSHKKKEQQLLDSDNELIVQKRNLHKASLQYVYKLQEVQERKKFEFVEHLLMFMQVYFSFFHQAHETANDCKEYMNEIQSRLLNTRSQYEGARQKTERLMKKMMADPTTSTTRNSSDNLSFRGILSQRWEKAGYLFLLEKNPLGSRFTAKWTRYFCMYTKENKLLQMIPSFGNTPSFSSAGSIKLSSANHHGSGVALATDSLIVLSCVLRLTDSIDKRFCFDIEVEDGAGKQSTLTLQATSLNDRRKWTAAMDGKEPNATSPHAYKKPEEFTLNETSTKFVKDVIAEIERRGVHAEGIYRLVGVASKVDRLLQIVMDPAIGVINYSDETEWELNTLTSALKSFFRNLPEPIMTFKMHEDFVAAAKQDDPDERLNRVTGLVKKLSTDSQLVLKMLIRHLVKVSSLWEKNKMTTQNIGVCFGPTLMRPVQETVQSIMEIKFNNIIVEILIENYAAIFGDSSALQGQERKVLTTKPVDSRPSLRFKTRPKVQKRSSDRENAGENQLQLIQEAVNTRFQRGHAIRGVPRSPSPRHERKPLHTKPMPENAGHRASFDNNMDDFGHFSPLDLNLNFDHIYADQLAPTSSSASANPHPKSRSLHASVEDRATKDPGLPERSFSEGTQPFRRNTRISQSERARSPPILNDNHNNSAVQSPHDATSTVAARNTKQHPKVVSRKSLIRRRISPLRVNRPKAYANHSSDNIQRTTGIASTVKPNEDSLHEDSKEASTNSQPKPDATDDHSMSFLWPKPGSIRANTFVEANVLPETRSRSNAVSSRQELAKSPIVSPSESENLSPGCQPAPPSAQKDRVYVALYSCEAEHETELSFASGDTICDVRESDEPGWLVGTLNGQEGLIPENYVREKVCE